MGPRLRARHAAGGRPCPLPVFFAFLLPPVCAFSTLGPTGSSYRAGRGRLLDLNVPIFSAACGFIALIGWAAVGLMLASGRVGLLGVSTPLVFHGFAVSLTAVAWWLSIDPSFKRLRLRR